MAQHVVLKVRPRVRERDNKGRFVRSTLKTQHVVSKVGSILVRKLGRDRLLAASL